jgi:hypothetical protein
MALSIDALNMYSAAARTLLESIAPETGEDYLATDEINLAIRRARAITSAVSTILFSLHTQDTVPPIGVGIPANWKVQQPPPPKS